MVKTIDDYLNLPYTIELVPDPDGGYAVAVKELPGCLSQGDTPEEALAMIREAMAAWLEVAIEDGLPIPEPRPVESYSGKFVARLPRWLHRRLAEEAEAEGVSLNQYVSTALAAAVTGAAVAGAGLGDTHQAITYSQQALTTSREIGERRSED